MRMWMVDPKIMCRQHLLGEHVECHMFLGHMREGKKLKGYADKNLFSLVDLFRRHEDLVVEMLERGYNHNSPMVIDQQVQDNVRELYMDIYFKRVNKGLSLLDLLFRCEKCAERNESLIRRLEKVDLSEL